jgi:hypothetical protein
MCLEFDEPPLTEGGAMEIDMSAEKRASKKCLSDRISFKSGKPRLAFPPGQTEGDVGPVQRALTLAALAIVGEAR